VSNIDSSKRILITGAHGLIGNLVYARLSAQPERYDVSGLDRSAEPSPRTAPAARVTIPPERLHVADLGDFEALLRAMRGVHTVVHLAADANGRSGWESILANNIIGTHNVFEAARQSGVQRIIFASSNQVVFGYSSDEARRALAAGRLADVSLAAPRPIDQTQPTRPLNDYACSKVFGEALAHEYAYTHGLSCLCLRIGWVVPDDRLPSPGAAVLWCSQRDIVQLIERCVDAPDSLRFDVFFGQSNNAHNFVDITHAREVLGYAPLDRAEDQLSQG
jgi:nucleoside-diphosphate-sugar epimerase